MSAQKLFITGGTGYIGGSILEGVVQQFPELQVTALLRSITQEFTDRYPKVKVSHGNFDDFEVIEKAAYEADIIIHAGNHNHRGCANAILSGLAKKSTPSYLIHLTGTGTISDQAENAWEGKSNPHVWSDIDEINDIYNLPEEAFHHAVDRLIMDASTDLIKTACVCPPDIYGQKTGVGNRTTFLVPEYVKNVMSKKEAFYLGEGENIRAVTHISDVVDLFVLLIEQALQGGGAAQWGKEGFYFGVSSEIKWKDAATSICRIGIADSWLPSDSKPVSWTADQVGATTPQRPRRALYIWGSNSRAESARAKRLGWKPHGPSFWDSLDEDVKIAAADAMV